MSSVERAALAENVQAAVTTFLACQQDSQTSLAVAAIAALVECIERSTATTMMGLQHELNATSDVLRELNAHSISLRSGCDLFLRFVTRSAQTLDFQDYRTRLIQRGEKFMFNSESARRRIASIVVDRFITDGMTIVVVGHSRCVEATLLHAAECGVRINVLICENKWKTNTTEERGDGYVMYDRLQGVLPHAKIVRDCSVAAVLASQQRSSLIVLLGAEGVVENGGIISSSGHYQVALTAQALHVPVYIVAESYKFARDYPIGQNDVVQMEVPQEVSPKLFHRSHDFTPPELITLLFTDLGILTPAAVSDHLVQLYA